MTPADTYRHFRLYYDPPPIPARQMDWQAVHEDYDGPGDSRVFYAETEAEARQQVDDYWAEFEDQSDD